MKMSVVVLPAEDLQHTVESIESAVMQQADYQFEVLVGDDGGIGPATSAAFSDRSRHLLRMVPVTKQGSLQSVAFNDLMDASSGEYVAVLRGGDVWVSHDKLVVQSTLLDARQDWAACYHAVTTISDGESDQSGLPSPNEGRVLTVEDLLGTRSRVPTSSLMFRRAALPRLLAWVHDCRNYEQAAATMLACKGDIGYSHEVLAAVRGAEAELLRIEDPTDRLKLLQQLGAVLPLCAHEALVYARSRLRALVALERYVPPSGRTAVVTDGDHEFLMARGREADHFMLADGEYAGFHPVNSGDAVKVLDEAIAAGVRYLMIPNRAYWWFGHYKDWTSHLDARHRRIWSDDDAVIYELCVLPPTGEIRPLSTMTSQSPRVTVIVTTYNHHRYIAQCLDSVIAQSTSFDYQIVVLDDFSQDGTRAILEDYRRRYPSQISLILPEKNLNDNRTFAWVYNNCIADYVATLDGDDYWTSSDKLQRQVEFLDEHHGCAISFHNVAVIAEDGTPMGALNVPEQPAFISLTDMIERQLFSIAGCSPVLRRAAVRRLPCWFEVFPVGDLPLYVLHAEQGNIGYINELMGAYRIHSGGYWSNRTEIEQLELAVGLYTTLAAEESLGHRGELLAQAARLRRQLTMERIRQGAVDARVASTGNGSGNATALGRILMTIIPSGASVAVVTQGDASLLVLDDMRALHLAPGRDGGGSREALFARGARGAVEVPWICERTAFDFTLHGSDRSALASVTVTRGDTAARSGVWDTGQASAWIDAAPNPVPRGPGVGTTTVSWDTGTDDDGDVYVSVRDLDAYLPFDSAEVVAEAKRLAADGVAYLVIPSAAYWWLATLPDFATYLDRECALLNSSGVCRVYAFSEARP